MKKQTLLLPAGKEFVKFIEIAKLVADAMHPGHDDDDLIAFAASAARFNLEAELELAALHGLLPLKDPLTLAPSAFPMRSALVSVADLRAYFEGRVSIEHEAPRYVPSGPDLSKLATPMQLISAFGTFTGMDASWFDNLRDTPALAQARKVHGKGGRTSAPPWFCPIEVMQWLVSPRRKKGRRMSEEKGWSLLEQHFPSAYNAVSVGDPRKN
jgi:hypothetical protein